MKSYSYTVAAPDMDGYLEVCASLSLPCIPSWQNTNASVVNIFEHLIIRVLIQGVNAVGYFVLHPHTGAIMQISAMGGSPTIYRELLALAKSCTIADMVKCINIDESSPFISFLEEQGWDPYVDQYEMITCFDPA